jgi:hypothetical protein
MHSIARILCPVALVALGACRSGNSPADGGATDAGTSDAGATDATAPDAPLAIDAPTDGSMPPSPIVVPDRTWTFVPIDGARCASGSGTGIGLRVEPGSRDLLLYFQGGGACADGDGCWGDAPGGAANVDGYGAAQLAEDLERDYALFDPSAAGGNPFRSMHMGLMPYCTGDGHAGNAIRELAVTGAPARTTYFVGAVNVELALARLAATFPDLERVWMVGTSAGGGGATFHYARVRSALGAATHLIVDSAPGLAEPGDPERWEVWGVVPPCAECTSAAEVRRYDRSLEPASRFGLLSFRYDSTTAGSLSPADFDAAFGAVIAEVRADPNGRTFIVDNSATMFTTTLHVVTTKNRPAALRTAYLSWLGSMVSGSGWENITLTPP